MFLNRSRKLTLENYSSFYSACIDTWATPPGTPGWRPFRLEQFWEQLIVPVPPDCRRGSLLAKREFLFETIGEIYTCSF
jgi:hypothetical protein